MTALQNIIRRAKQIRKPDKKITWKDAVKKASLEYNKGAKVSGTKKKLGATKFIEKGETKKTPVSNTIKVVRRKNGTIETMKKVSGFNELPLTALAGCMRDIRNIETEIEKTKQEIKIAATAIAKNYYRSHLRKLKMMLSNYKKHLTNLKKHL
jgi:hypothetical protein